MRTDEPRYRGRGRGLRLEGAIIIQLEDGLLAEEREYFDTGAIQAAAG